MLMENTITFLGTAGARVMVANQIQASGGMWLDLNGIQLLVDPGPGSIVQSTKRKLRAEKLSAIILSHRHLDHSGDMNIMTEAMTQGGFKPGGKIFLPADALNSEPVVYSYQRKFLEEIVTFEEGKSYNLDSVRLSTPVKHIHGVETYGLRFDTGNHVFSYIADSRYFEGLIEAYSSSEMIIINVVFTEPRKDVPHLSVPDVEKLVLGIKPKTAILTHFGMGIWKAQPWKVAEELTQKTGIRVISARDGMKYNLSELDKI